MQTAIMQNPAPTAQEILDFTTRYLGSMKQRCYVFGEGCQYRSPDKSSACAVGAMMSDEEVEDRTKQNGIVVGSVNELMGTGKLPERLVAHKDLLSRLQSVHDTYDNWQEIKGGKKGACDPAVMRRDLLNVAVVFGLDPAVIDEVFPKDADPSSYPRPMAA